MLYSIVGVAANFHTIEAISIVAGHHSIRHTSGAYRSCFRHRWPGRFDVLGILFASTAHILQYDKRFGDELNLPKILQFLIQINLGVFQGICEFLHNIRSIYC